MNHIHKTRWWFKYFCIFTPTCEDDSIWSICFKGVGSTTDYMIFGLPLPETNNSHLEDLFFVSFLMGPGLFFRVQTRCWRETHLSPHLAILHLWNDENDSGGLFWPQCLRRGGLAMAVLTRGCVLCHGFFSGKIFKTFFCGDEILQVIQSALFIP